MIESIIEWSIRNRFLVILASLVLGVAGVRALLTMPVIRELNQAVDVAGQDPAAVAKQFLETHGVITPSAS